MLSFATLVSKLGDVREMNLVSWTMRKSTWSVDPVKSREQAAKTIADL